MFVFSDNLTHDYNTLADDLYNNFGSDYPFADYLDGMPEAASIYYNEVYKPKYETEDIVITKPPIECKPTPGKSNYITVEFKQMPDKSNSITIV